ncbi:MAG: peptidylprolyl isomerase [Parcubacteria group bacterium CG11_big_fil_rev_8_21_14_0_20_39_22]|nr:MAG: peptidylprolyl isomerase [Parcubacteria group bacterium CG11_big_fil_rev_8_21_14_0_20_39_22]
MKREIPFMTAVAVIGFIGVMATVWILFDISKNTNSHFSNNEVNKGMSYKTAVIETNKGIIEVELLSKNAPKTVGNFVTLVEKGFYDGTKFHRVIPNFMIQGGDPLTKDNDKQGMWGTGGPGYKFADEINAKSLGLSDYEIRSLQSAGYSYLNDIESVPLVRGVMAMANTGPDTNGSQFFIITVSETPWLSGKHTGFARVSKGMDVVDAINNVRRNANDVPNEPIVIEKIELR